MLGVIFERVAGLRVREDGEALSVQDEPGDDVGELFGLERELATAARMRADQLVVHAFNCEVEGSAGRLTELFRLRACGGVVIDVGVVFLDRAHGWQTTFFFKGHAHVTIQRERSTIAAAGPSD